MKNLHDIKIQPKKFISFDDLNLNTFDNEEVQRLAKIFEQYQKSFISTTTTITNLNSFYYHTKEKE